MFRPDLDSSGVDAGEDFDLEMTLIGAAIDRLPYVVVALRGTPQAALSSGKLKLTRVLQILPEPTQEIWRAQGSTVAQPHAPEHWIPGAKAADVPRQIRVNFESPTEIIGRSEKRRPSPASHQCPENRGLKPAHPWIAAAHARVRFTSMPREE
jgi:hypothetical protein